MKLNKTATQYLENARTKLRRIDKETGDTNLQSSLLQSIIADCQAIDRELAPQDEHSDTVYGYAFLDENGQKKDFSENFFASRTAARRAAELSGITGKVITYQTDKEGNVVPGSIK